MEPPDAAATALGHNNLINHTNYNNNNNNYNNSNINHIPHGHLTNNKDHYGSRQGSLTNSTGSERESDSACACGSETESPNEPYAQTADNDVFDWWFHRNRNSKKSR